MLVRAYCLLLGCMALVGFTSASAQQGIDGERIYTRSEKSILGDVRRYVRGGGYDRPWMNVGKVIHWKNDKDLMSVRIDPNAFTIASDYLSRHSAVGGTRISKIPYYFTGEKTTHSGIDFMAPHGTPLIAAFDGKIDYVRYRQPGGYTLTVSKTIFHEGYDPTTEGHDANTPEFILDAFRDTIRAQYSHVGNIYLEKGDPVKRGQIIAEVWSTGIGASESAPHLHFAMHINGETANPHHYWFGVPKNLSIRALGNAKVSDVVTVPQFEPNMSYDTPPGSLQIATSPLPRAIEVEHYLRLLKQLTPVEYRP